MRYPLFILLLLFISACSKPPAKPLRPAGDAGPELVLLKGLPPFDLSSKKGIDEYVRWADSLNAEGRTRILSDSITGEMGTAKEVWIFNDYNICLKLSTITKPPQILKRWIYLFPSEDKVVFLREFHYDGIIYREDIFYYPNGTAYLKGFTRNSYNAENLAFKTYEDFSGHFLGIQYHDDPNKINIMIRIYLKKL